MKIYPSLISSNILELKKTIDTLEPHCDGHHIDVMDDHFVPNLTWGPAFVNAIASATSKPCQVHLMVDNPAQWVDRLKLSEQDSFLFHIEAVQDVQVAQALIKKIKQKNIKVGITINPKTGVDAISDVLEHVDEVLIMSVEPGFSGQKFMPEVVKKVSQLREIRVDQNLSFSIIMDGGIGAENIAMLAQEGVDGVGIASALFSHDDYVAALKKMYELI